MNARAAAMTAAWRGWAVFPCRPGDKRPAVPDWERRACSDPDRVGRYWPSDHHNIGLACGPSRLVVVDLDTHGPLPDDWRLPGVHHGRDVLALLAEWAGQPWPVTYMVKTPTGGLHLYYTAPGGTEIRNSAGKIGPLVDVRGAGGYVLAAGSVLDERAYPGNPECRELVTGGRGYELADDSDPEPLPAWLAALAEDTEPAVRPGGRACARPASGARLRGLLDTVRGGQAGDRNGPRQGPEKLAGFRVRANPLNPANPATLRGLRVVRVIPAGFENAGRNRCLCCSTGVLRGLRALRGHFQPRV
jgi:hypothetical protein